MGSAFGLEEARFPAQLKGIYERTFRLVTRLGGKIFPAKPVPAEREDREDLFFENPETLLQSPP